MSSFCYTEMGKIFAHGIHEHNSAIGHINQKIFAYKRGRYTIKDIPSLIEQLENDVKKLRESMDFIYENVRKLQGF